MLLFVSLVLRIQFVSSTFSGLESSGEIFVTIVLMGAIPDVTFSISVNFSEVTATG